MCRATPLVGRIYRRSAIFAPRIGLGRRASGPTPTASGVRFLGLRRRHFFPALGVSVDWLRQAEKEGQTPRARRQLSGWRVYSAEDIATIQALLIPTAKADRDQID